MGCCNPTYATCTVLARYPKDRVPYYGIMDLNTLLLGVDGGGRNVALGFTPNPGSRWARGSIGSTNICAGMPEAIAAVPAPVARRGGAVAAQHPVGQCEAKILDLS
jgi:hypothetical protein